MKGKIFINGLIGEHDGTSGVFLADVIAQVKKQPEATGFDVHINSEGGLVSTGFDIYNYLKSLGLPIRTIGEGVVASIATVIFMAGSERQVRPNTLFMIHLPMGGIQGTADEISEYAARVKKTEKQIIDFYTSTLNLQREAIEPMLKDETFLSEDQLAGLGITTSEALGVVAKAYINKTDIKPKQMKNTKNKSFLSKLKSLLQEEGITNKHLYDAENNELVFPDLGEDDEITVGAQATLNGEPAEGEIVIQDGRTLVFSAGTLTEIKDAHEEEDEAESEEVIDLRRQIAALTEERDTLKTKATEAVASLAKKDAIINKIKALEMDFVDEAKPSFKMKAPLKKESRFASAMTNLKTKK